MDSSAFNSSNNVIILGIDPGSRYTGYGMIALQGKTLQYVTHGVISVADKPLSERLTLIFSELQQLILSHQPAEAAIEEVFVGKSAQSALKLGQARGVALLACAQHALPFTEYSPRTIKLATTGFGGADKEQIGYMVQKLLKLPKLPKADAADALAIAICHAQHITYFRKINKQNPLPAY